MSDLDFDVTLGRFVSDFEDLQRQELALKQRVQLANEKFFGWLKEQGLPENFTLPGLIALGRRKRLVI